MVTAWLGCHHTAHYYPIKLSPGHFYLPSNAPISNTMVEGIIYYL